MTRHDSENQQPARSCEPAQRTVAPTVDLLPSPTLTPGTSGGLTLTGTVTLQDGSTYQAADLIASLYSAGFFNGGAQAPAASAALRPFMLDSIEELDRRAEAWMVRYAGLMGQDPDTTAWRRDGYRSFRAFLVAEGRVADLLAGDWRAQKRVVEDYVVSLRTKVARGRERVLSRRTVHGYVRATRAVLGGVAAEEGMHDPFDGVATPKPGTPERPRLPLNRVGDLLAAVDNYLWGSELERWRNAALVRVYVLAGMRLKEPIHLLNGDVNFDTGDVAIRASKGRDGGKHRLASCASFVEVLQRYADAKRKAGRTEPAFFVSLTREGGIGGKTVVRLLAKISERIGFHVTTHMLRRTAIDLMRETGLSLPVIQKQVGHKNVTMTLLYSSVTDDEQRRGMARLDPGAWRTTV